MLYGYILLFFHSLIELYGNEKGKEIWKRFEVHYTPKHASWLNQAEIAIGMFSSQCLGDGRVANISKLKEKPLSGIYLSTKNRKLLNGNLIVKMLEKNSTTKWSHWDNYIK